MNSIISKHEAEIRTQIAADLRNGVPVTLVVENKDICLTYFSSVSIFGGYKVDDISLWLGTEEVEDNELLSELESNIQTLIQDESINVAYAS